MAKGVWEIGFVVLLLPDHIFPLFQSRATHGLQIPLGHIHLLECGVFHGLQRNTFSIVVSPRTAGESLFWWLEYLFLLLLWLVCSLLFLIPFVCFPSSSSICAVFLPFFGYVVTEASPAWLTGWAVSCGGSIFDPPLSGMGSVPVSSQSCQPCSYPPAKSLPPTPSTYALFLRLVLKTMQTPQNYTEEVETRWS